MTPARLVAVAATTHHNAAFGRVSAVNIEAPSERLTRTAQGLATVNGGANLSASQVPKVRRLFGGGEWIRTCGSARKMGGSDIIDQAPMARSVKALFPAPGAVILNVVRATCLRRLPRSRPARPVRRAA